MQTFPLKLNGRFPQSSQTARAGRANHGLQPALHSPASRRGLIEAV